MAAKLNKYPRAMSNIHILYSTRREKMRILFCCLSLLIFNLMFTPIMNASDVMSEDFSDGFTGWTNFGSPSSQIVDVFGKSNVFDNNGDSTCGSGIISDQIFDISNGIEITADVYLQIFSPLECCANITIGLTKNIPYQTGSCVNENYHQFKLADFGLNENGFWTPPFEPYSNGGSYEGKGRSGDSNINQWKKLKIIIDSDQYVHIYLDQKFLGKSSSPLPQEYADFVYLLFGEHSSGLGGKAYLDNVTVKYLIQDTDGDGVSDEIDNCVSIANNDQADFDLDGIGDLCDTDTDNDGLIDDLDVCKTTQIGSIVNENGCSIDELCQCNDNWKNHGAYVRCIARTSNDFLANDLINEPEKGLIVSKTAKSYCGRKKNKD